MGAARTTAAGCAGSGLRRVLRALLRRPRLPALRAPVVRRRRSRRRDREPAELDDAARAGRRRRHPGQLYRKGLDGHFRQYTEAKTTEVPLGRDGMYYQEFHACFDWMHHGEAWSPIVLQGLSEPDDRALQRRMRRWAGMVHGRRTRTSRTTTRSTASSAPSSTGRADPCCARRRRSTGPATRSRSPGRFTTLHGETILPGDARPLPRLHRTSSATTP